jgi:tetratricopeptide (TPR) repeat protein
MASLKSLLGGRAAKSNAIEQYNLGLAAKYRSEWAESLKYNQRAAESNPNDDATWWNLGIAATALGDWREARRAWGKCAIELADGDGEVRWAPGTACVRLRPDEAGEVVWGERIDPARMRVLNVPLASSERRYGDIVLNDGAPEGTRISAGREYAVFNELMLWRMSEHSTFEVELEVPNGSAMEALEERCRVAGMWVEDWGTVRTLCAACSKGNPGEHMCSIEPAGQRFGFAAKSEVELRKVLEEWADVEDGAEIGSVRLVVSGVNR